MKSNLKSIITAFSLLIAVSGTNFALAQIMIEKQEARTVGPTYQAIAKDVLTIKFDENSDTLSDSSLTALSNFVKETGSVAKVDRYLVAAWADKDYPAKGKLSSGQRKLASNRADHIKKALEASGAANVDTFEMTQGPNWIQRALSTETAEIKGKGLSASENQKHLKETGQRFRNHGGPRTAVIIAKFKNEMSSL